jgi:peptidoglycan/LPS O-acetylase OafA/YrhL
MRHGQLTEVNPARSWSGVDGIDLLRGLAIFFVLMNHVNMQLLFAHVPYMRGLPKELMSSLVWNGQQGVQIFFAVSGFLITATSLRRWKSLAQVSVADFYRLRFARIAPLLLELLAILSVLHLAHVKHFVVSAETGGLGRALVAALTFHVNWLEASPLPGNWDILWLLSVEETFYLAFPWVCRFFGRGRLLIALLLVFVVLGPFGRSVLTHGNPVWREYSYLGGMDAIAMGCLTAIALHGRRLSRRWLRWFGGMGGALLVFCLLLSRTAETWIPERTGLYMTLVGIGASMLIAVAAQTGWRSPRALAPLLLAGQRSYEVYLTHMFLVVGGAVLFVSAGKPMAGVPVLFLAVIAAAILVGEVVARFYSEPMNHRLRGRWGDGAQRLGSVLDNEARASL